MRTATIATLAPVLLAAALLASPAPAGADEHPSKDPATRPVGEICTWKSADGLVYEYFVPKGYDAAKGANLLLILHGSNLDRRWGFANHGAGEFRPDDVVVCPDGTTSNGKTGFNFLNGAKDLQRLHGLHEELKKTFKVNATYLYGHSQGSFFSFLYAGAYPDDVQGLVGQASGVWGGTAASPKQHKQAIVLMHGTADPVVPYPQSVGGLSFYREAKFPMARLRSLEGWNHWPAQQQTGQELAWCEGMTSADPARVEASLAAIEAVELGEGWNRDPAALYQVAKRAAAMESAPAALKERAAKDVAAVEALAKAHADAIAASLGKGKGDKVEDAAWVGHLAYFLRDFDGVPACDALAKEWADRVAKHKAEAVKALKEYYRTRQKDPAKAFPAGVEAIREGFLWNESCDGEFLNAMTGMRNDAAKLKLGKAELKAYDEVVPAFVAARKKGFEEYARINRGQ
jgi:poly(3-hydroxybutyrate) depolymerase